MYVYWHDWCLFQLTFISLITCCLLFSCPAVHLSWHETFMGGWNPFSKGRHIHVHVYCSESTLTSLKNLFCGANFILTGTNNLLGEIRFLRIANLYLSVREVNDYMQVIVVLSVELSLFFSDSKCW